MASSSSSSIQKRFKYDVFLSFRGEDTRKNFVDHLYAALQRQGIHTYKDDERIKKGKRIDNELITSIEDSRFFIIVFSKNYASSSWCLEELVKIMECHKTTEQTAYPVFYDVEPSEVRKQSGPVGEAFTRYKKEEAAGKWREALEEVACLAGWELKNTAGGHEAKMVQIIVEEISLELRSVGLSVDEKLVGMKSRIKDVESYLQHGSDEVRMIGIKGMGGGGKTTLARAVFDKISIEFEGKSFVENVREVSKASLSGLTVLQNQVLSDVLNDQGIRVCSVHDGKKMMRMRLYGKKVPVVLDDVDDISQLEALVGEPNWFKPGSRIIITTRDEQVLIAHRVNSICDVSLLSNGEAICLFSKYAFGRETPIQRYEELSRQVVRYAAGLPLTMRVLGSFLCGKNELEWKDALERLKVIPLKETLEKLELSYISLEDDYKEIFLDVACLLKGWHVDNAIGALESCGFHARNGLRVLQQKSLITISDHGYLGMHDHIEEMGHNIVRRNHPNDPNKHSRLWINKEVKDILGNKLGTEATRCIRVKMLGLSLDILMKGLGHMKNLRFLDKYTIGGGDVCSNNWKFDEDCQYFPNALRYLNWKGYPFRSLPKTFEANNLVALHMRNSNIEQLWEGGETKVLNNLTFLDLSFSKLTKLSLGLTPNLQRLNLKKCYNLVELDTHIGCQDLTYLNVNHSKLKILDLRLATNLENLRLKQCNQLVELHMPINTCRKLTNLNLTASKLITLDLRRTPNIENLCLKECHNLLQLKTTPVGYLNKLANLDLSGCSGFKHFVLNKRAKSSLEFHLTGLSNHSFPEFQFECVFEEQPHSYTGNFEKLISLGLCRWTNFKSFSESICGLLYLRELNIKGGFTNSICKLKHLKSLKLEECYYLDNLPKDIGELECLETLYLSFADIKHLPDSICKLKNLKSLKLEHCKHLEKLPEDIDQLECLLELHLLTTRIKCLPNSICKLKHLKSLSLRCCWFLEKLPENLGQLERLEYLIITGCLQHIPESICRMKCLKHFHLPYCISVKKLPKELGNLECLEELNIEGTGIRHVPESICLLKGRLRVIGSKLLLQMCGFTTSQIQTKGYVTFCCI